MNEDNINELIAQCGDRFRKIRARKDRDTIVWVAQAHALPQIDETGRTFVPKDLKATAPTAHAALVGLLAQINS